MLKCIPVCEPEIDRDTCHDLLQYTATHCETLQRTATHCNALQHTATNCNTLQQTATHCNKLQHIATHTLLSHLQSTDVPRRSRQCRVRRRTRRHSPPSTVTRSSTLRYCMCSNALQCVAAVCCSVWPWETTDVAAVCTGYSDKIIHVKEVCGCSVML